MAIEWDKLKAFYYVAKEQNLSKASKLLNLTQSALSRQIALLEHQSKTILFIRHPRGLTLTKQGEILFTYVNRIHTEIELAENEILGKTQDITGQLTITAAYGYTSTVFFKHLTKFMKHYPEIKIRLICDDNDLDLTKKEADVAVRTFNSELNELEHIHLHERRLQLYASKEYLEAHGIPSTPNDLNHHKLLVFSDPHKPLPFANNYWILNLGLEQGQSRNYFFMANSVEVLIDAAKEGLGIAAFSHDSCLVKNSNLIRVLPDQEGEPLEMYMVYPKSIKNLAIVKILENFLINSYAE